MEDEFLNNLILLGHLHEHRAAKMHDYSAEFIGPVNQIIIRRLNENDIKVRYNLHDQIKLEVVPDIFIYDIMDELLIREEANKVEIKSGKVIEVQNWKEQLRPIFVKIQNEKDYNHYLKHLRIVSERFEVEYFDDILVLRDREKNLLTNVLKLKNAVQQCI